MPERLQKVIAAAGIASRRKAEELIGGGRVKVNGRIVSEPGFKVDAARDNIVVDGRRISAGERKVYLVLNKPKGCVTTLSDEKGRKTVASFLEGVAERVFPVGRLDYSAEGVLLLTNDGELAHRLMHPSFGARREYEVKVKGFLTEQDLKRLLAGVELDDGPARAIRIKPLKRTASNSWAYISVGEGRNRLVKRMFEKLGHPVLKLRRVAFAGITLAGMRPGELRELTRVERVRLRQMKGLAVSGSSSVSPHRR